MPDYIYLDIETIPTQDPAIREQIAASVKAPANYTKPESIQKWMEENGAAAIDNAIRKTSLDAQFGHIACIGWAINADPVLATVSEKASDEPEILQTFFDALASMKRSHAAPVIVGHNVIGFDIRLVWQRCFVLGIAPPTWFPRDAKPWASDVFDTMTAWAGSRDTISMDNLCRALGLPGKGDISGSDIATLWAQKSFRMIGEYCMSDVEKTRAVHWHMMRALGELPPQPKPQGDSSLLIDDEIPDFGGAV